MRIIFETGNQVYRIIEKLDESYSLEDLKGDCFNPDVCKTISVNELRRQELEFEERVRNEGVFGYVLEKWNSQPGHGYEHVDSCWGFVGHYDEASLETNHYIIEEMKNTIAEVNE